MGLKLKKIVKPVKKYFDFYKKAGKKLTKAVRHGVRKVNPFSSSRINSAQTYEQASYVPPRISELM